MVSVPALVVPGTAVVVGLVSVPGLVVPDTADVVGLVSVPALVVPGTAVVVGLVSVPGLVMPGTAVVAGLSVESAGPGSRGWSALWACFSSAGGFEEDSVGFFSLLLSAVVLGAVIVVVVVVVADGFPDVLDCAFFCVFSSLLSVLSSFFCALPAEALLALEESPVLGDLEAAFFAGFWSGSPREPSFLPGLAA